MRTRIYLHIEENRKDIPILPHDLALSLRVISSNYPCLKHVLVVPKMFASLKFDYVLATCKIC